MNGIVVDLDAFDLSMILMMAERKNCVKEAFGTASKKHNDDRSEFEIHYIGSMGEWAVKKSTGCKLSRKVTVRGDPGPDTHIGEVSVQIKARMYTGKNLEFFVDSMDDFNADVLVGVQIVSPTRAVIVGYINKRDFSQVAVKKDYGYGERFSVPACEFRDIKELVL